MATPATPTFDDYAPYTAHGDVRQAPTTTGPKPRPFSPLDMHTQPSHLASPQTPHLVPPLLSDPPAPHFASPQTPLLVPPLLSDPPALRHTRPVSLPPASCQPQDAIRTDAASAESLEAHDATEKETKKPRHQEAHGEHALTHHTSASKEQLARPANWESLRNTEARLHDPDDAPLEMPEIRSRPINWHLMTATSRRRLLRKHDSRQHKHENPFTHRS